MSIKFYITTPIYYVNYKPHIGHTYTTVAADVLARYHRLKGDKTFFLTGTDEHGAKVAEKAKGEGKEPQEFTDEIAAKFKSAWQSFNISNDNFLRTTDPDHIKAVQNALTHMYEKGDIYKGKYEGLYCQGCEQYKNEKDLKNGKCPDHGTVPVKMSEESYMFKLSKYAGELLKRIESDELEIRPPERKNEVISFYKNEGLCDISFSRKNVAWGIPLPWDKSHTAYVWADAFLNYLTGLGWDGKPALDLPLRKGKKKGVTSPPFEGGDKGWWEFFPSNIQLMSKDILRVHATIWPAMLLSLDLPLPKKLFIHGFFLIDGQKMSKSVGNVIAPEDLIKRYGVDASRYLLMSATTFGQDGDIGWGKFDEKYNADLANGLGNLVARVSNLLEKNKIEINIKTNSDQELSKKFTEAMDSLDLDGALAILWQIQRACDEELSAKTPWKIKDSGEVKKILEPVAQNILDTAYLLEPFMPDTVAKILKQFSEKQIKKSEPLFPRLN